VADGTGKGAIPAGPAPDVDGVEVCRSDGVVEMLFEMRRVRDAVAIDRNERAAVP